MSRVKNKFLVLRQVIKLIYDIFFGFYCRTLKFLNIIDCNIPPNSIMRRTSGKSISRYFYSSITTSLPIITIMKFLGLPDRADVKILDFGCGAGSQLRVMNKHFIATELHGCDVDLAAVEWASLEYPSSQIIRNSAGEQLPYPDQFFDAAYTVSTFSHFSLEMTEFYLSEFHRVLKSGGLLILTIEGCNAIDAVSLEFGVERSIIEDALSEAGYFHSVYEWLSSSMHVPVLSNKTNIFTNFDRSYGVIVFDQNFFSTIAERAGFEVLGFSEGVSCDRQDLVVVRKKYDRRKKA